jgi:uncharacterized protein YjbI with pentapeptide repeats
MSNDVLGRRHALILGVSEYRNNDLEQLSFCKNDGQRMCDILTSLGYNVPANRKLIGAIKADQMKESIYDFFTDESISSRDTLIFYYSGHGIPDINGDIYLASSEINPRQPFRSGFAFSDLADMMNRSVSTRIVTILDCCYSGAAKLSKGSGDAAAKIGATVIEDQSKLLSKEEGKCILAASQATQEAFGKKTEEHSVFTYYLLEGLKGNQNSVDSYGNVTVDTLGKYVYDSIMSLPEQKRPNQKPIRKLEVGGTILLANFPELAKSEDALLRLLKECKVSEFNSITKSYQSKGVIDPGYGPGERSFSYRLDFGGKEIPNVNLSGIDLHEADICRMILYDSDFSNANLAVANLASARADRAVFRKANLQNAYLSRTDLSDADLSGALLSRAILLRATLHRTTLSDAIISKSVLVGCTEFSKLKCINADFKDTIIDNKELVDYLETHGAKNVSCAGSTKEELKSRLNQNGYQGKIVEKILERSLLI